MVKNKGSEGKKISKVEIEMKWKKINQTQGTRVRRVARAMEGRICNRGSYRRTYLGNRYCYYSEGEDRGWDPQKGRKLVTATGRGGWAVYCLYGGER